MIEELLELVRSVFSSWGYPIIALGAMLENSVGLGLVVPGETIVLLGGFYAAEGVLRAPFVALTAAAGQVIGDILGYGIGRRLGRARLAAGRRALLLPQRILAAAERYYERHGRKTLVLGRLVPGIRTVLPLLAGVGRMEFRRFVAFDLVGAALWATLHTTIGYLIGSGYPVVRRYAGLAGVAALLVLALALIWSAGWIAARRPSARPPGAGRRR